jgi:hypothetical protein
MPLPCCSNTLIPFWMWGVWVNCSAERASVCEPQACSRVAAWCVLHVGVGTIVESTSGNFTEGQRVVSAGKWNGTWQEYALADESSLVRRSKNITTAALQFSERAKGRQRAPPADVMLRRIAILVVLSCS